METYINIRFLPVQTRSLVEEQAADWYCPDGHAPEQAAVTIRIQKRYTKRIIIYSLFCPGRSPWALECWRLDAESVVYCRCLRDVVALPYL